MDQQQGQMQNITPTVSLPSADLITYRFDQIDKNMQSMNLKLDMLTNNFITRKEADLLVQAGNEKARDFENKLKDFQWYWRVVIGAAITALAVSIASYFIHKP